MNILSNIDDLILNIQDDIERIEVDIREYQYQSNDQQDLFESNNIKEIVKQFDDELKLELSKISFNAESVLPSNGGGSVSIFQSNEDVVNHIRDLNDQFQKDSKKLSDYISNPDSCNKNNNNNNDNICIKCKNNLEVSGLSGISSLAKSLSLSLPKHDGKGDSTGSSLTVEFSEWRSLIDDEITELYALVKELKLKIPLSNTVDRPASPVIRSKTNHKELLLHNSTFTNLLQLKNELISIIQNPIIKNLQKAGIPQLQSSNVAIPLIISSLESSSSTSSSLSSSDIGTNSNEVTSSALDIQASRSAPSSPRKDRERTLDPPETSVRSNSAEREKIKSPKNSSMALLPIVHGDDEANQASTSSSSSIIHSLKLPSSPNTSLPNINAFYKTSGGNAISSSEGMSGGVTTPPNQHGTPQSLSTPSTPKSHNTFGTFSPFSGSRSIKKLHGGSGRSTISSPHDIISQDVIQSSPNKNTYYYKLSELDQEKSEEEIKQWIQKILQIETLCDLPPHLPDSSPLSHHLRSGVILCQLINALKPNTIKKINMTLTAFHQLENIINFLQAAEKLGVDKRYLFHSLDLYEIRNMKSVVSTIYSLARVTNKLDELKSLK